MKKGMNNFYDAENRLPTVSSNGTLLVANAYDHLNRRVQKITPISTSTFLYDDWNPVIETVHYSNNTTGTFQYFWGKDLSGTLQGAGGVGGLLAVCHNNTAYYYPQYDHNGNITDYVDDFGTIVAHYEYDVFGNTIVKTGIMTDVFRHRFSTKYYDIETGLYHYGECFYSSVLGRFINRDPINEDGGLNLYAFCENNPITKWDYLGMGFIGPDWGPSKKARKNRRAIYIYHNFPSDELTDGVKSEVDRIFQHCFKKCDEKQCHTVSISWEVTDKTSDNYNELDIGKSGRNWFLQNPRRIGMFLDRVTQSGVVGYNNGYYNFVNPNRIREQAKNFETGMGVAIAHEVGFHGIGNFTDFWSFLEGYVDSRRPPGGGSPVFSEARCNTICEKLGIRTKK